MLLIELFDRDNILCPDWLSNQYLEDDWKDSTYSYEEGKHIWSLETPFKNVRITFDGTEYHFIAYDEEGEELFDNISTEEYEILH